MKESHVEEFRRIAERAAAEVREALVRHADVMSKPAVRYSEVAAADDRVIDALDIYREFAEKITGLSVLLRVPIADVPSDDYCELPESTGDEANAVTADIVLKARWYLNVADPQLITTAASGEEVSNRDLQSALVALFERDVLWPPSEYSEIGLTVTGTSISVHAPDAEE